MKLFRWLKRAKTSLKRPLSTIDALSALVALNDLEKIVLKSIEKRSLINVAAEHLGMPVDDLLLQLASRMDVSIVKQLEAVQPESCGGLSSLRKYRELGALPLLRAGIISGVCGVCPEAVKGLPISEVPFYLCDWARIEQALDESEKLAEPVLQRRGGKKLSVIETHKPLVTKVLKSVISEVTQYGAKKTSIICVGDRLQYHFETEDGRFAQGDIHQKALPAFRYMCASLCQQAELGKELVSKGVLFLDEQEDYQSDFELIWYADIEPEDKQQEREAREEIAVQEKELDKEPEKEQKEAISGDDKPALQEERTLRLVEERQDEQHEEDPEQARAKDLEDKKVSILLLEDNATFAKVLRRYLEREDYEIQHVTNGKQALDLLEKGVCRPSLIISDVHMPEMNGFVFIKQVKDIKKFADTPVVMLTSDTDVETELEFITRGANAFVAKSSDPRILGAHVKRLLQTTMGRKAA